MIFSTRRNRPRPPTSARAARAITASSIGFISRGGPGSSDERAWPLSIHSPGAVPFGFGSTVAPRGTIACRRLMSGIVMPRRAKRSRSRSTIASSTSSGESEHARDGVARHVVFGRTEPAGDDDEIGPRQRALDDARQLADVVGDDRLEADVVADGVQPLGDEQRVGVDAKRRQHLAADARMHAFMT